MCLTSYYCNVCRTRALLKIDSNKKIILLIFLDIDRDFYWWKAQTVQILSQHNMDSKCSKMCQNGVEKLPRNRVGTLITLYETRTDIDAETNVTKTVFMLGLFSRLNSFSDLALGPTRNGESRKCVRACV